MEAAAKPHVVCVPLPLQAHIISMLNLAKLLHYRGFHITFVNTELNHKRIQEARGPEALHGLPDFCFETLPIEHPPSDSHISLALNSSDLLDACRKNFLTPFRGLIARLNDTATFSSNPPVTCILSDFVFTYPMDLHEELGINSVLLCTMGASGFMAFKHFCDQIKQCLSFSFKLLLRTMGASGFMAFKHFCDQIKQCLLLKDPSNQTGLDFDSIMKWIPDLKGAQKTDLFRLIKTKSSNSNLAADYSQWDMEKASKASAVLVHTFETLESEALNELSSMFRRVYSTGPLHLLLDQIPVDDYNSINCSLWNQDTECIKWLDSKEPNSVIYASFGSIIGMTQEQLVELAWGLAHSNNNFLLITRPDLIMGKSAILPKDFLMETNERCFIASWCQQEQVLNHPSVGGFMNHGGWNSVLESISASVPMVCWPLIGETFENCRKSCNEWGVGMELSHDFKRDEVEKLVKELMTGEKGKQMKNKAREWKKMAEEAASSTGSSASNLDNLVKEVLLSKS